MVYHCYQTSKTLTLTALSFWAIDADAVNFFRGRAHLWLVVNWPFHKVALMRFGWSEFASNEIAESYFNFVGILLLIQMACGSARKRWPFAELQIPCSFQQI